MENNEQQKILHDFKAQSKAKFWSRSMLLFLGVCVILGVTTGYLLGHVKGSASQQSNTPSGLANLSKGTVVGSNDTKTFSDTATGIMQAGGINNEGQFHLVRPGGPSQNVYMTSSLVDLSQFINKKVQVWGQTQKAQTAGWLMDVGRVEVLE